MFFQLPADLPQQMKKASHALRGALTTLMAINYHLGQPTTEQLEATKANAKSCLRDLADLANTIDLWADHLRVANAAAASAAKGTEAKEAARTTGSA